MVIWTNTGNIWKKVCFDWTLFARPNAQSSSQGLNGFCAIHGLCLYKIEKLTNLFFIYIINCDLMIFCANLEWTSNACWFMENYLSLSKPKDTGNDVIASIDNITNVCFFIFWQNKRIMAVTCSTNHGIEYNLLATIQRGVLRYICICDGKSTLFNGGTSCYLHYWICPLTT